MNVIKNRKEKNDEKDYFVFYGTCYGAVAGGLLENAIGQRIDCRRKQFGQQREHPYAE